MSFLSPRKIEQIENAELDKIWSMIKKRLASAMNARAEVDMLGVKAISVESLGDTDMEIAEICKHAKGFGSGDRKRLFNYAVLNELYETLDVIRTRWQPSPMEEKLMGRALRFACADLWKGFSVSQSPPNIELLKVLLKFDDVPINAQAQGERGIIMDSGEKMPYISTPLNEAILTLALEHVELLLEVPGIEVDKKHIDLLSRRVTKCKESYRTDSACVKGMYQLLAKHPNISSVEYPNGWRVFLYGEKSGSIQGTDSLQR